MAEPATDKAKKAAYMKVWRAANRDKIRAGSKRQLAKRNGNPVYKAYMAELRQSTKDRPHNQDRVRRSCRAYRLRHPEKQRAKHAVLTAVRNGTLTRPSCCPECGEPDPKRTDGRSGIHAHHDDYGQPLKVTWLCRICHQRKHEEP